MAYLEFGNNWKSMHLDGNSASGEHSLYVSKGREPETQRQLNLYYYFLFIQDVLLKHGAKNILEVGCGRGTISLYLALRAQFAVSLLDNEEGAIALARADFGRHGVDAPMYVRDVLDTGFANNSFDAVVSIGLAEHFKTLDELFAEQYRILKPGGVMVSLNIPKKASVQWLNSLMRLAKKITGSYRAPIAKDYYRNSYSPKDYGRAARRAGFTGISITRVCPFPIYTPITQKTDKRITALNKKILSARSLLQRYPYKTNALFAQAHFLVGTKE